MIRVLVMIAVMGFVLAAATLTAAFALGGPELIARGGWNLASGWHGHGWDHWDDDDWDRGEADTGATATRSFTWKGGDRLEIDVPANVHYTQGPAASVTVTGSNWAVQHLEVEGGHIRFEAGRTRRHIRPLEITIQAPGVTDFDLSGRTRLEIAGYKQEHLRLEISGSGRVEAIGTAERVDVEISGSGDADLAGLNTKGAEVDISGSGEATIAPTEWARLEISGNGDVTLTTNPARLETEVTGSGEVHHSGSSTESPKTGSSSPSPSPTPSPTPAKKKT